MTSLQPRLGAFLRRQLGFNADVPDSAVVEIVYSKLAERLPEEKRPTRDRLVGDMNRAWDTAFPDVRATTADEPVVSQRDPKPSGAGRYILGAADKPLEIMEDAIRANDWPRLAAVAQSMPKEYADHAHIILDQRAMEMGSDKRVLGLAGKKPKQEILAAKSYLPGSKMRSVQHFLWGKPGDPTITGMPPAGVGAPVPGVKAAPMALRFGALLQKLPLWGRFMTSIGVGAAAYGGADRALAETMSEPVETVGKIHRGLGSPWTKVKELPTPNPLMAGAAAAGAVVAGRNPLTAAKTVVETGPKIGDVSQFMTEGGWLGFHTGIATMNPVTGIEAAMNPDDPRWRFEEDPEKVSQNEKLIAMAIKHNPVLRPLLEWEVGADWPAGVQAPMNMVLTTFGLDRASANRPGKAISKHIMGWTDPWAVMALGISGTKIARGLKTGETQLKWSMLRHGIGEQSARSFANTRRFTEWTSPITKASWTMDVPENLRGTADLVDDFTLEHPDGLNLRALYAPGEFLASSQATSAPSRGAAKLLIELDELLQAEQAGKSAGGMQAGLGMVAKDPTGKIPTVVRKFQTWLKGKGYAPEQIEATFKDLDALGGEYVAQRKASIAKEKDALLKKAQEFAQDLQKKAPPPVPEPEPAAASPQARRAAEKKAATKASLESQTDEMLNAPAAPKRIVTWTHAQDGNGYILVDEAGNPLTKTDGQVYRYAETKKAAGGARFVAKNTGREFARPPKKPESPAPVEAAAPAEPGPPESPAPAPEAAPEVAPAVEEAPAPAVATPEPAAQAPSAPIKKAAAKAKRPPEAPVENAGEPPPTPPDAASPTQPKAPIEVPVSDPPVPATVPAQAADDLPKEVTAIERRALQWRPHEQYASEKAPASWTGNRAAADSKYATDGHALVAKNMIQDKKAATSLVAPEANFGSPIEEKNISSVIKDAIGKQTVEVAPSHVMQTNYKGNDLHMVMLSDKEGVPRVAVNRSYHDIMVKKAGADRILYDPGAFSDPKTGITPVLYKKGKDFVGIVMPMRVDEMDELASAIPTRADIRSRLGIQNPPQEQVLNLEELPEKGTKILAEKDGAFLVGRRMGDPYLSGKTLKTNWQYWVYSVDEYQGTEWRLERHSSRNQAVKAFKKVGFEFTDVKLPKED